MYVIVPGNITRGVNEDKHGVGGLWTLMGGRLLEDKEMGCEVLGRASGAILGPLNPLISNMGEGFINSWNFLQVPKPH